MWVPSPMLGNNRLITLTGVLLREQTSPVLVHQPNNKTPILEG